METVDNKNQLKDLIKSASATQLINSSVVGDRFKALYQTIHGAKDGERFYEAEKFHFLKMIQENSKIASCSKMSLYGCFMDVAVNGLSFDPSFKHLYIVPFNTNIGTKQDPKWETRASLQISGYGELALRKKQGQIKYADNPVLVFEGDIFEYGTENDKTILKHISKIPRKSENIVACYIKITRNDNSIDYKVLSIDEVMQFKKFSKDPNSKAWTDGLPGMIQAKTIKHAFKSYPKVRTGEFSQLSSETIDEQPEIIESVIPDKIDYGVNSTNNQNLHDESFLETKQASTNNVTIEDEAF